MKNAMKKAVSFVLVFTMLLTLVAVTAISPVSAEGADVWDGTVGTAFDGGSGSKADPYLIGSAKTLAYLASVVNSGVGVTAEQSFINKFFKLTNDIDLNDIAWTPIGFYNDGTISGPVAFSGTFDGDDHRIFNLNVTTYNGGKAAANACAGLFGSFAVGKIQNLGVESGTVTCKTGYAGGIVGAMSHANAIIENCYSKATVVKADNATWTMMGGIVGRAYAGSIIGCTNYGVIDGSLAASWSSGNNCFGGIVGVAQNVTVSGCANYGTVSSSGSRGGGLAARITGTSVFGNCYASGNMIGSNQYGILFGSVEGGTYENITYYTANQSNAATPAVKADASSLTSGKVTEVLGEMLTGASVRCKEPTGLRFETSINKSKYDELVGTYGAENVKIGTIIAPAVYVSGAGAFTKAALDAYKTEKGLTSEAYIDVVANTWRNQSASEYVFAGSIVNIMETHYQLDFAAVGYIAVTEGDNTTYYYASYHARDNFRSIETVVNAVLADADNGLSPDQLAVVQNIKATIDAYLNK